MEAPGEKLLIRLWDTIFDKGISGLLEPWQTRRKKRAQIDGQRHELLTLAQAEQEVKDIRAGRKALDMRGQLVDMFPQGNPMPGSTESRQTRTAIAERNRVAREMRAEVNTSKALLIAESALEDDPQTPPDEMVDEDWLFRWREAASMVSTHELQQLWGRALAGEIKSPGSCALRTLDFLKNLSHGEAQLIAQLAPFAIDSDLIVREPETKEVLEAQGISDWFLLQLQPLGVVGGHEGVGWHRTFHSHHANVPAKFRRALVSFDRLLGVTHDDVTKTFDLKGCFVTPLGTQVLRLGSFKAHEDYLKGIGKAIVRQGFQVTLAPFERVDSTTIRDIEPVEIIR